MSKPLKILIVFLVLLAGGFLALVAVNHFSASVEIDGIKIKEKTLIRAGTSDSLNKGNLNILANLSAAGAIYTVYDKDKKTYTCVNSKTEALDLVYRDEKDLNIAQEEKNEIKNYNVASINEGKQYFELKVKQLYGTEVEKKQGKILRVHKCSYLELVKESPSSFSYIYKERPITKDGVEKLAYYLWALHHFGFPHFVKESASDDANNFYHTIYFAEPHLGPNEVSASCDYVEVAKQVLTVNKQTGSVKVETKFPGVKVKTGKCYPASGFSNSDL